MKWISRLWPEERIALLFFAGVAALFATRLYPFTLGPLVVSYFQFLLAITVFVLLPWMIVALVRRLRGRPLSGAFLGELFTFWRALASLSSFVVYTNLKCRLLLLHPRLFDQIFGRLDDLLHMGGGDFVAWVAHFHAPSRSAALQLVYYYAWAALAIPLAVAMARSGVAVVRRTLAALALCYIAGGFSFAFRARLGAGRARHAASADTHIFGLQQSMLQALRFIVQNPQAPAVPFFGLAAFPSPSRDQRARPLRRLAHLPAAPPPAGAVEPRHRRERDLFRLALRGGLLPGAAARLGRMVGGWKARRVAAGSRRYLTLPGDRRASAQYCPPSGNQVMAASSGRRKRRACGKKIR